MAMKPRKPVATKAVFELGSFAACAEQVKLSDGAVIPVLRLEWRGVTRNGVGFTTLDSYEVKTLRNALDEWLARGGQ